MKSHKQRKVSSWAVVGLSCLFLILVISYVAAPYLMLEHRNRIRGEFVGRHESYVIERWGKPTREIIGPDSHRRLLYERFTESDLGTRVRTRSVKLDENDIVLSVDWYRNR